MSKYSSVALIYFFIVALAQAVPDGRIVGGLSAMPGQFPYQVSLKLNGVHHCGGSIISRYYILTSAHCVVNRPNHYTKYPISSLSVQAGTNHLENGGIRTPVAETIVHPRYVYEEYDADIALVMLTAPLLFSSTIQRILLSSKTVPDNMPVVISGWGTLWQGGPNPVQLQWTILHNLSQRSCRLPKGYTLDKFLCLGHSKDRGICTGDGGGPAVVDNRLVGVASFFLKKCGTNRPDLYVKVSRYLKWIKKHSDLE